MNNIDYYNGFYKELSILDEKGNTFDKIKNILPSLKGKETFLDIGCGHGGVSEDLIKKGFSVTGIEINDDAIKSLYKKGFEVIKKDINKPLQINNKFDIVMLLDVLEHIFDPLSLLLDVKNLTTKEGYIIVTVPLYFDFLDRLKILFTGSIISMDNLCYGVENYKKFRSYNYDHIRFFRPSDIIELGKILDLEIDKIEYSPTGYYGRNLFIKVITKIISNRYSAKMFPGLLAHRMNIRFKVK